MPRKPQDDEVAHAMAKGISARLRAMRSERRWTQQHAAQLVKLSTESYARIERAQSLPSFPTLSRLAEAFETTSGFLLGDTSSAEDHPPPSHASEPSGYALPTDTQEREQRRRLLRRVKRKNPQEPPEPEGERKQRRAAIRIIRRSKRPDGGPLPGSRKVTPKSRIDAIAEQMKVLDMADLRAVESLVRHLAERQAEVFEQLDKLDTARRAVDPKDDDGPK